MIKDSTPRYWKEDQVAFVGGIPVKAFKQLTALRNLVRHENIVKYNAFGLEIHILTDISEDLGYEGIPTHINPKNYFDKKIDMFKGNIRYLEEPTAEYIKRVISLMEKVRDSKISLPEGRRSKMKPTHW